MQTTAVVLEAPERLTLRRLALRPVAAGDVVVAIDHSGISTGTERLLYRGTMPAFPGMGYPLVPGYESVGRVVAAGADAEHRIGDTVFVPGANCYTDARGLFGGAASDGHRGVRRACIAIVSESLGERMRSCSRWRRRRCHAVARRPQPAVR